MPTLPYNLEPKTPDQNSKPTSMLDNIPFVLSSQINVNTDSYTCGLEDTEKSLLSLKKMIDSDAFNYDFSNDRKMANSLMPNEHTK